MGVNHQAERKCSNAADEHENPSTVLPNLERTEDADNAFDHQIYGEHERNKTQSGRDTIQQSQARADSNQRKNCVEPARNDVFAKDCEKITRSTRSPRQTHRETEQLGERKTVVN